MGPFAGAWRSHLALRELTFKWRIKRWKINFIQGQAQKTPLAPVSFGDPPRAGVAQSRSMSLAAPFSGYEERFGAPGRTLWASLCLSLGRIGVAPPRTLRSEVPGACPVRPARRGYRPAQVPRESQPHAQRQRLRQLLHLELQPSPAQPSPSCHPPSRHPSAHSTVPVPVPAPETTLLYLGTSSLTYNSQSMPPTPTTPTMAAAEPPWPWPNPEPSPEARNLSDAETETSRTHAMAADAANQPV